MDAEPILGTEHVSEPHTESSSSLEESQPFAARERFPYPVSMRSVDPEKQKK
jgi:hypothetical protein